MPSPSPPPPVPLSPRQDDSKLLKDFNITPNSRILVTKGAGAAPALGAVSAAQQQQEQREARLEKLKAGEPDDLSDL